MDVFTIPYVFTLLYVLWIEGNSVRFIHFVFLHSIVYIIHYTWDDEYIKDLLPTLFSDHQSLLAAAPLNGNGSKKNKQNNANTNSMLILHINYYYIHIPKGFDLKMGSIEVISCDHCLVGSVTWTWFVIQIQIQIWIKYQEEMVQIQITSSVLTSCCWQAP